MEYGTVIIVIALIAIIGFFVMKGKDKPSQSEIISVKNETLSYFSIEPGDCEKLIKAKKARLAELTNMFVAIQNGTDPITAAQMREGCQQAKQEAIELRESTQKLRDAKIEMYNANLKIIESALAFIKVNDERKLDPDDEYGEEDENTRDLIEKSLEGAQAALPKLREELRELGYTPT